MTEQSVLVYELFLSLNIPDFSLFFVEKSEPPPPLSQQPSSKTGGPVKSPLFENLVRGSTLPLPTRKGGAHYGVTYLANIEWLRIQKLEYTKKGT